MKQKKNSKISPEQDASYLDAVKAGNLDAARDMVRAAAERNGITVNSIRGLFPKDTHEWITWIQNGKALYLDKEKIQNIIDQQRMNFADVAYVNLDSVSNIIRNFKNPSLETEKNSEISPEQDAEYERAVRENPDVRYSLKRHQQTNPVVVDGKVQKEYRDLLNNKTYTPEKRKNWQMRSRLPLKEAHRQFPSLSYHISLKN